MDKSITNAKILANSLRMILSPFLNELGVFLPV